MKNIIIYILLFVWFASSIDHFKRMRQFCDLVLYNSNNVIHLDSTGIDDPIDYSDAAIKGYTYYPPFIDETYTAINMLLDEYFEECYNDSTCIYYITFEEEWIHREPTLKGFREFLRKKIKKGEKQ